MWLFAQDEFEHMAKRHVKMPCNKARHSPPACLQCFILDSKLSPANAKAEFEAIMARREEDRRREAAIRRREQREAEAVERWRVQKEVTEIIYRVLLV